MWLAFLACWRPEPWTPPPPPPEALDAMRPPEAEAPAEEEAPEPDAAPEEQAAPEPEDKLLWTGKTVEARLTVVDDLGQPVGHIETSTPVEVLREDGERVKIRCASCSPPITGWLQAKVVTK